ncbi:VTT domain-containing protein [Roseiconus nitratireducens]|uniref:TVP38/TMEM64 family membrane protein n=1 Tax=Roseiconus nitratireducens TaxID=2605748 RepID=A0A5M6D5I7_9BACT|nr:VTT domain-containing protein [Roseiconus nitratireducens]KAA5542751.1 VTT domain-containing protein [Roseiconus nitratireducens]
MISQTGSERTLNAEADLPSDPSRPGRPRLGRRIWLPAALVTVGLIFYLLGFRLGGLSERLETTGDWAPFFFWLAGVAAMSLMMPKTMVSLTAGALFGTVLGCPLMLLTAVTAASLNYAIGRVYLAGNPDPPTSSAAMELLPDQSLLSWRQAISRLARDAGFGLHLLARLSPLPTTVISYSMGAARARFLPYLAAATVAVFPQFLYIHAASLATSPGGSDRYRWASSAVSLTLAAIVSVTLPQIALRRLNEIRRSSGLPADGHEH